MNNSLGEMIRQIRMEKGLSQFQLAELIHVDRSSIANWETGRRLPDADMLTKLSNTLDIDVSFLINASLNQNNSPNVIMVDDERIILTGSIPVLKKVLPYATITGFTKPSETLAYVRKNRVSLTFLDIEMGKVSGLDLCRDLLTINPRMNVIFLTAYPEYSFDAWDTGAYGFLLKPISEEAVNKQLATCQVRFESELFVEFDTPHTNFRIPPLTLQPIIENSIKYGVDPESDPLYISVQTNETAGGSEIIVIDNGPGFDENNNVTHDNREPHIAIGNIRERLSMMCGGTISFSLRDEGGTVVRIWIPWE